MSQSSDSASQSPENSFLQWLGVAVLIYLLMVAVGLMGTGFQTATGARAEALFTFATNPFLGLMVGIIATALIQSSSTVTSVIVGLVAGGLPVATAIPIVMGANIGTTITNTFVSLGHIQDEAGFEKALAAATVHDFFNLLGVAIFLPLEILWHPLEQMAWWLASAWASSSSLSLQTVNIVKLMTEPLVDFLATVTHHLPSPWDGIGLILLGLGLIFLTITGISQLLKALLIGRAQALLHRAIGQGAIAGMLAGTLITVLVQSSSTTTSLMVPLAGAGIFTLNQVYPFTLGANIGTCITALLAATAITGTKATPALEIAMVHLLYNVLTVALIYSLPGLRRLPLLAAETLAAVAAQRKPLALAYIVIVFFGLPGLLLGVTSRI